MKLINKIWQKAKSLIQKRNEDYTLIYDFELCKNRILKQNQEKIIAKLMPAIRAEMLKTDGLLISDKQARKAALEIFDVAKEIGSIDSMNNCVRRTI